MTSRAWTHAETVAQMVAGTVLAQIVLAAFGVEFDRALALNGCMFAVSYVRTYAIRRAFATWRG